MHVPILNPQFSILNSLRSKAWSGPVSRILFLLRGENHSSAARIAAAVEQPTQTLVTDTGESMASLFGLAPQGVCRAVDTHVRRGALLPHRFTLTSDVLRRPIGGLFSVALSVASPRLAVSQPAARRSSDFPRQLPAAILRFASRRTRITAIAQINSCS